MSERWLPPSSRPYSLFSPARLSDPMSRMFWASMTTGVGRSFSYTFSSAAALVSVVMLPSSFLYSHQPAPAETSTRNDAPRAAQRSQGRFRRDAEPSLG